MPSLPASMPPPAPVSSPAPMFVARPRLSLSHTAKAREESLSPARSISGLRTYGSSPSSGWRKDTPTRSTMIEVARSASFFLSDGVT